MNHLIHLAEIQVDTETLSVFGMLIFVLFALIVVIHFFGDDD